MSNNYGPKIAKARNSGLILHIDPAELNSSGHLSQTNIVTNYQTATTTASNEERVEVSRDPWGRIALIDRSEGNDAGSNYDGGYTTSVFDGIDSGEAYRFTYFFRVDNKGSDGRLYFGLYGYNSSTTNIAVINNNQTSSTTNPYFSYPMHYDNDFVLGRWYMFVAYVHPSGSNGVTNAETGFWDMLTKTKLDSPSNGNVSHNASWDSTHTKTRARQYLYYSTDSTVGMSWLIPRIEKIDGNQPTVAEMLNSPQDRLSNLANPSDESLVSTFYPYRVSGSGAISMEHTYKSVSLNGSSDILDLGADKDFKTTGGWTISTWFKHDTAHSSKLGNFIGSESINYNSWYWTVYGQKLALWDLSPGSVWKYGDTTIETNTWYHATLVSDANNTHYYCYLNGEDDMSSGWSAYNGSWQSSKAGLRIRYIGRGNSANGRYIDGNVASTQAWSRALTAAEIKQNFNEQRGRFGV